MATTTSTNNPLSNNEKRFKTIILPSPSLVIPAAPISTNLKFVCDVCGYLCTNMDNLKTHLSIHNEKNERTVIKMATASTSPALVASSNGKINSILIANRQQSGLSVLNHPSAVINLPQSLTVLNLKEVSPKPQSADKSAPVSNEASESKDNSKGFPVEVKTEQDLSMSSALGEVKLLVKNEHLNKTSSSTASLSDYSLSNSPISSTSGSALFSPTAASSSPTHLSLPYHYSESENIYLCNLCNCNYDSLRSIKAHLWKHSGHHELSYPTSSTESAVKAKNQASNFNDNIVSSSMISSAGNFKRNVTLQLPASTKNKLQSSLNSKSKQDLLDEQASSQILRYSMSTAYDSPNTSFWSWNPNEQKFLGSREDGLIQLADAIRRDSENNRRAQSDNEMSSSENNGYFSEYKPADVNNNYNNTTVDSVNRRTSRSGICSVLLEVVEKLHDEEESHQNDENNAAMVASNSREGSADSQNAASVNVNDEKPAKKRNTRRTTGKTRHIRDLLNQQQEIATEENSNRESCVEIAINKSASSRKRRKDWSNRKAVLKSSNSSDASTQNLQSFTDGSSAGVLVNKKMRLASNLEHDNAPSSAEGSHEDLRTERDSKEESADEEENECKIETTIVASIYEDVAVIQRDDEEYVSQKVDQEDVNLLFRSYLEFN